MNLSRGATDPTKYDLMSTTMHEIDEVLGIASALTGSMDGRATGAIWPEDLFRYDQTGGAQLRHRTNNAGLFFARWKDRSVQFNQHAGGDFNDWYSYPSGGHPPQVQDAYERAARLPIWGWKSRPWTPSAIRPIRPHFLVTLITTASSTVRISPSSPATGWPQVILRLTPMATSSSMAKTLPWSPRTGYKPAA